MNIYFSGEGLNASLISEKVYNKLKQKASLSAELEIIDENEIRELNFKYRGKDLVTDVLSFPTLDGIKNKILKMEDYPYDVDMEKNELFIGTIVICLARATTQAKDYGHSLERELSFLFTHGLLHLFGYDHENDKEELEMKELTEKILEFIPRN